MVTTAQSTATNSCANAALGTNGALMGFTPSPNDAWHQDISQAPVDASSNTILNSVAGDLAGSYLHPDFGSIVGGNAGIPYTVVDSTQTPSVPVDINLYIADSDITLAPIPADATVEGAPLECTAPNGDQHLIVFDRATCVAYEYWQAQPCAGHWTASNTALWDFTKTENRPFAATSADAAGLSIFEGLVRYDEIVAGSINHALRFTAKFTKQNQNDGFFVAPATHASGTLWGTDNVIGMRIRLKADFDISGYSKTNQIILTAMKKYGMILADNGSNLFFQGTADARWDDDDLSQLKAIEASSFELVQRGTVEDSSDVPAGNAPTITSFTASTYTVTAGTPVLLSSETANGSYDYIDNAGFTRGSITVSPTQTTTYTLTSRNLYGSTTASVTVNVSNSLVTPTLQMQGIANQVLGAAPFTVTATSNSPAAITFVVLSGPAKMAGAVLTVTGTGAVTVQASQGSASGFAATSTTTEFIVTAPSKAATLSVSGFASHMTSGALSVVQVTALDGNGVPLPTFTGTISLSSSDPNFVAPPPYTFQASDAGTHYFTLCLNTLGVQSITASSGGVSGTQYGITVVGPVVVLTNTGLIGQLSVTGYVMTEGTGLTSAVAPRGGLAVDQSGNVWSVTASANSVNFMTSAGTSPASHVGGGLNKPIGIAVDGRGSLWVANSGTNTVSAFDSNGTAQSGDAGYGSKSIGANPTALAVDSSGGLWVTSSGGNSVTHLLGVAAPVSAHP